MQPGLLLLLLGGTAAVIIVKKRRTGTPVIPEEPSPEGVELHCPECGLDFIAPLTADVYCPRCNAVVFDLETGTDAVPLIQRRQ